MNKAQKQLILDEIDALLPPPRTLAELAELVRNMQADIRDLRQRTAALEKSRDNHNMAMEVTDAIAEIQERRLRRLEGKACRWQEHIEEASK